MSDHSKLEDPIPGRCNARVRSRPGGRCRRFPLKGKTRCALHGGRSCGVKTAEGLRRIVAAHETHGKYTGRRQRQKRRRTAAELEAEMQELLDRTLADVLAGKPFDPSELDALAAEIKAAEGGGDDG